MKPFFQKYYGLFSIALLCLFYVWRAIDFPIHDFTNYYFGGYFLANGTFNASVYFPYHFNQAIANLGYQGLFGSYAPNTPFLALVFYPFSLLSLASAKLVFNSISVLLFVYSIQRLASVYKVKPMYLFLIPIVFFIPIKNNLLFGQVYFALIFLLSESWIAYKKNRFVTMSLCLSFAILLKVFPVLFLLHFLFKKELKPFLYTCLFSGLLLLISMAISGSTVWLYYFETVLPKASNGEIATAFVDNYQSVFMFFKRIFIFDAVENPGAIIDFPGLFHAVLLTFKIGILAVGFYISRKVSDGFWVFSYWILAMLLLSPYGSSYTLLLLIFPYLAISKSKLEVKEKVFFVIVMLLINMLPLSIFRLSVFPFSYIRLIFFGLLFLVFILVFYKKVEWQNVAKVSVIAIILMLLFQSNHSGKSAYLLDKDSPILIYDYQINGEELTYYYWNEKGKNHHSVFMKSSHFLTAEIKNNQVLYKGKSITNDNSHKVKPMIIDDKTLIYLSDFDRGIGFYTLRKIDLH